MNNLRITPKKEFRDSWGTGDHQSSFKYEVRRDFTQEELKRGLRYSDEVIKNGVAIETFNSETNAEIFMNALKQINKLI